MTRDDARYYWVRPLQVIPIQSVKPSPLSRDVSLDFVSTDLLFSIQGCE